MSVCYWNSARNSDGERTKPRQQIASSYQLSLAAFFSAKPLTLAPMTTLPSTKEGTGLRVEGERAGTKRLGEDGATATGERRTATVVKERREDAAPRTEEPAPARAWSVACMISLARKGESTESDCRQVRFLRDTANERA